MRYAVIRKSDLRVINAVEWDGISEWKPPENTFLIKTDIGCPGDTFDDKLAIFSKPSPRIKS